MMSTETPQIDTYLAAQLVLHGEVDEADAGSHQCVDEPHGVQPRLELGGHHAHEDLPAQRLHTVLSLHALADAL